MVSQVSESESTDCEEYPSHTSWQPLTQLDPDDPDDPDDPPSSTEDQQKNPEEKPLSKSSNKEKRISVNSIFTVEELSPDDEIYMLQCPEKFNKQDFFKSNIDFSQMKPIITSENEVYQIELMNFDKKAISLAVPKKTHGSALVNLPLKGQVVIKKVVVIPGGEKEDIADHDTQTVAFPSDIKVRHPLLGEDWKTHIDLVNEALKKKYISKKDEKDKSLKSKKESKKLKRENIETDMVVSKKKKK